MTAVEGYQLHLYCDCGARPEDPPGYGEHCPRAKAGLADYPDEFGGRNKREAYQAARASGWKFKRDGRTIAPACAQSCG